LCDGTNQIPAFQLEAMQFIESVRGNGDVMASGADSIEDLLLAEKIWSQYIQLEAGKGDLSPGLTNR
jgi:hypothetical protein